MIYLIGYVVGSLMFLGFFAAADNAQGKDSFAAKYGSWAVLVVSGIWPVTLSVMIGASIHQLLLGDRK